MSWSVSDTSLEEVQENFDKNYPEPTMGVREQFEAALDAVEHLLDNITNDGDSISANVNKYEGTTRFALNGHVATIAASTPDGEE